MSKLKSIMVTKTQILNKYLRSFSSYNKYHYYPSSYYKSQDNNSSYPFFSLLFLSLYTYYRCNKLEKEIEEIKNKKIDNITL
jgi:hypothetical protein